MSTKLPRTESITIRVGAALKQAVEQAAAEDGRTVSNWLERTVRGKLQQVHEDRMKRNQNRKFTVDGTPLV